MSKQLELGAEFYKESFPDENILNKKMYILSTMIGKNYGNFGEVETGRLCHQGASPFRKIDISGVLQLLLGVQIRKFHNGTSKSISILLVRRC